MKFRLFCVVALTALLNACVLPIAVGDAPSPQPDSTQNNDKAPKTNPIIIAPPTAPIIVLPKAQTKENSVHVCTLSAFTYTYKGEDTNRGKARLSAKKQCLANFDGMFCRDEDIECTEY